MSLVLDVTLRVDIAFLVIQYSRDLSTSNLITVSLMKTDDDNDDNLDDDDDDDDDDDGNNDEKDCDTEDDDDIYACTMSTTLTALLYDAINDIEVIHSIMCAVHLFVPISK